ncbi:MAG: DUF3368 domain-containing protein [Thermomicrobiales bacterium]
MSDLSVIADASALIALDDIGLLGRLAPLFIECLIPPAVAQEIAPTVRRPAWVTVRSLTGTPDTRVLQAGLGPGETEVLRLALELGTYTVIVDERAARRLAVSLGLPLIGTVGLLARAKRQGIISAVRPNIEALVRSGFYASSGLIDRVLREAGEMS